MIPRMAGGEAFGGSENEATVQRCATPSRRKSNGGEWRQSLAPQAALKPDPRPIAEKSYMTSCINSLLQYLVSSGYEHPVSRKTLSRPSGRDFNQIVTFILRCIDPSFNDGTQKFEDEVAMAFKSLGYPYPISKTALVAAGSPHTWPTLLAALMWLIELLGCEDSQEEDILRNEDDATMNSLEEIESRSEKAFFRYLNKAYVAFLSADDPQYEALEEALVEYFEKDNLKIEGEFQRVTETNMEIQEEIKQLLRNGEELPELKQRREDYATDLEKFYDLVKKLEEHKATLRKKVEERTAELVKREEGLQQITAQIDALKRQVQSQEFSVEDIRRMQKEKVRQEESIARAAGAKNEQNKALWEVSTELSQRVDQLRETVEKYNWKVMELHLSAERDSNQNKYELELHTDLAQVGDPAKIFNGVDIKGSVLPMVFSLKCDFAEKCANAKRDTLKLLDQKEQTEKATAHATDCVKELDVKSKECEQLHRQESAENEMVLSNRLKEVDAIETKVFSLRDPMAIEAAISKYTSQCEKLEKLRLNHHNEILSKKKAIQAELDLALRALAEQKEYIQNQLYDLEGHIQRQQEA